MGELGSPLWLLSAKAHRAVSQLREVTDSLREALPAQGQFAHEAVVEGYWLLNACRSFTSRIDRLAHEHDAAEDAVKESRDG